MKNFRFIFLLLILGTSMVFGAKITSDLLKIGKPGSAADKILKLGDTREIRSNETTGALEFSNDGTNYKKIGSGGGGSDAINILSDSNPDAEASTTLWTASAGTFTTTEVNSFVYTGQASFDMDFGAQSQTLKSAEIEIQQGLYNQSCQARFFYINGDDSVDITATVRDGNDAIVSGSQSKVLSAATIWTVVDLGFVCPSASEIAGDSELANMYVQFEQTAVGDSDSFRFDQVHLGGLIGLTTAALPDVFGARIDGTGTPSVTSESAPFISSITDNGTGDYTVNFSETFTVLPAVTGSAEDNNRLFNIQPGGLTLSSVSVRITAQATDLLIDSAFAIKVVKQGADAKQSALVYESIPVVHENVNTFNTKIESDKVTVMNENVDWIDGSCVSGGTGLSTCTFVSGVFTEIPNCSVEAQGFGDGSGTIVNISASSINYQTNSAGSATDARALIICTKANGDFKLPEKQLILVNGVETSNNKGIKTESCYILASGGTPTVDTGSKLCESWISSITDNGVGGYTVNIIADIFSEIPNCTCNSSVGANGNCSVAAVTTTSTVPINTFTSSTGTQADQHFTVTCKGIR